MTHKMKEGVTVIVNYTKIRNAIEYCRNAVQWKFPGDVGPDKMEPGRKAK